MKELRAKPQLGFSEAFRQAGSQLFNFGGRSRRSEFWWFMLVVIVVNMLAGLVLATLPKVSAVVSILIMAGALGITVRRLHDSGHAAGWLWASFVSGVFTQLYVAFSSFTEDVLAAGSDVKAMLEVYSDPLIVIPYAVWGVTSIVVIVFCCFDSKAGTNRYGDSPKYVTVGDTPSELEETPQA